MAEKIVIVHSDYAERCLQTPGSTWHRDDFVHHMNLIREVRKRDGVLELDSYTNPADAGQLVESGDDVSLYGLFSNICVQIAEESMSRKGAIVERGKEPYSVI